MYESYEMSSFLFPLITTSFIVGIIPYYLGVKKGYRGFIWIFLAFCPVLNFFTGWLFVGLPDRILHQKIETLLSEVKNIARDNLS